MKNFLFIATLCLLIACNDKESKELPEAGSVAGIEAGIESELQAGMPAGSEAGIEGGNEMPLAGMMLEKKTSKLEIDLNPTPFR